MQQQNRCQRCDSPSPELHPAMQFEGEVQPCPHEWHKPRPVTPHRANAESLKPKQPTTPAEVVAWLRKMSKSSCTENRHNYYGADVACYRCGGTGVVVDERYTAAADLIESQARMMQEWREKAELLDWLLQHGYAVYSEYPETGERFTVLLAWQSNYKYSTPNRWFDTPLAAVRAAKEAEDA